MSKLLCVSLDYSKPFDFDFYYIYFAQGIGDELWLIGSSSNNSVGILNRYAEEFQFPFFG